MPERKSIDERQFRADAFPACKTEVCSLREMSGHQYRRGLYPWPAFLRWRLVDLD